MIQLCFLESNGVERGAVQKVLLESWLNLCWNARNEEKDLYRLRRQAKAFRPDMEV